MDKVGNRLSMTNNSGQHDYTYDNIYQLTKKEYPVSSQDETFDYDYTGNRKTGYTANSLNQYSQAGTVTYTYDNNGNLTSDGSYTFAYDYTNKLTSAAKTGTTASYKYDPFGRRTQKTVNGSITNYLYSGAEVLVEYDGSFKPLRHYVYGPGIDEPVRMSVHSGASKTDYYYHADGLGSITHITDTSGTLAESYEYTAFGIPTIRNASNKIITTSSVGNRFMFTGREWDAETGLYYYRLRYYSPTIGRFLQTDPLGYYDSMNLYQYCNNNPVNFIDPFGLWSEAIHNDLIDSAFPNVSEGAREAMKEGSRNADARQYQDLKHSYMHAMRCTNQTVSEAQSKMERFINNQIDSYNEKKNSKDTEGAYEALGQALHPIMDSASPSHEDFQEWAGVLFHIPSATRHAYRERNIDSNTKQQTIDIVKDFTRKRL